MKRKKEVRQRIVATSTKLFARDVSLKKSVVLVVCGLLTLCHVYAQESVWQPSSGHTQVQIWPGTPPDAQPVAGPELAKPDTEDLVAGQPWLDVEQVSQPTMTVYAPKDKNTGAAIVVFPGGGYRVLAMDLEGTEVCDWLTSRGITAVLLKYRVPGMNEQYPKSGAYPKSPLALEDAQRTIGLVRFHAAEWHIDPHKIGVIGFSAGGHLVAATSTNFAKRLYPAVDAADKESCRPDFAAALYPGHLLEHAKAGDLNPYVPVTPQTPPTFILQSETDPVDDVENSLVYFEALKNAGVPTEMHLYAAGGHGFGLRRTKFPITNWPQLLETWLRTIGVVSE